MLYGVPQAGFNPPPNLNLNIASLIPGESLTLLNGAEIIGSGSKSISFNRGPSPSSADEGITFDASGMAAGTVIDVQAANQDVDGQYFVVGTMVPDANGNGGYTDIGRSNFYRVRVTTFVSGNPVVVASR